MGIGDIINTRNVMLHKQKELYISSLSKINMNMRELLKNDFGNSLVNNYAKDVSGEIVRKYFNTEDYYITVDQMFNRIVKFSYDKDEDLLNSNEAIRKALYNINDNPETAGELDKINESCGEAQKSLADIGKDNVSVSVTSDSFTESGLGKSFSKNTLEDSVNKEFQNRVKDQDTGDGSDKKQPEDPSIDYKAMGSKAVEGTANSIGKIIGGQVIYYMLPPVVFETQILLRKKGMTLDRFFEEIKQAGKRIIKYVTSKIKKIFKNVFSNSINKFIKTFFDIIIETVKAAVSNLFKILKQLMITLVNCVRIMADKNTSAAEKAEAVTKTLSISVNSVVTGVIFTYLRKQWLLPRILIEPLQLVMTLLSTNVIMLILQKADLFDIRYGLLVGNIETMFNEENLTYISESQSLYEESTGEINRKMADIKVQMEEIKESFNRVDIFNAEVTPELEKLNRLFNMKIDFNKEWQEFITP